MSATAILKQFCPSLDSEIVEYINGKPHEREGVGLRVFCCTILCITQYIEYLEDSSHNSCMCLSNSNLLRLLLFLGVPVIIL